MSRVKSAPSDTHEAEVGGNVMKIFGARVELHIHTKTKKTHE